MVRGKKLKFKLDEGYIYVYVGKVVESRLSIDGIFEVLDHSELEEVSLRLLAHYAKEVHQRRLAIEGSK